MTTGEYYNPAANVWQPTTPMGTRRSCLGICAYDGLIYCVGGYDGASCLSSVERYDPLTAMWTSCPAMSTKRRYCRSVVLGKKAQQSFHSQQNSIVGSFIAFAVSSLQKH